MKSIVKIISILLIGGMSFSFGTSSIVQAKSLNETNNPEVKSYSVGKEEFDRINSEIQKYLIIESDGTISLSKKTPRSFETYNLQALESHLNQLNEQVLTGEIIINDDLSINEKNSRGNVSKRVKYWWGYSNWYSYNDVKYELQLANNAVKLYGASAVITGVFSPAAGLILGLGSWYWNAYSSDLSLENSYSNGQGVVADVNWAGVYNIYRQW